MMSKGAIKARLRQLRAVRAELAECEARAAAGDAAAATMAAALRRDLFEIECRIADLMGYAD